MFKKILSIVVITGLMGWGLITQGFAQNTTSSTPTEAGPMDNTQTSAKENMKPVKHHSQKKMHAKKAKTKKAKTGKGKAKKRHTKSESANTEIKPQDLTPASSK